MRAAVLGGAIAGLVLGLTMATAAVPPPESTRGGYISLYTPARTSFEVLLDHGDGQAYAALARDPALERTEWWQDAGQQSFFAHRPVLPWSVWLLSAGGRPGAMPGPSSSESWP